MATDITDEQIYEEAKKRVKAKRGFYSHLVFYVAVNIICFLIWVLGDRGYPWFLWVLGPWGLLVVLPHYLRIFVFGGKSEKRAIEKEAERIRREQK